MKIRYLPDDMPSAYILFDGEKFPIRQTNRNDIATSHESPFHQSIIQKQEINSISMTLSASRYMKHCVSGSSSTISIKLPFKQSYDNSRSSHRKSAMYTDTTQSRELVSPKSQCSLRLPQCAV